jgi:hypothetical protein
MPGIIGIFGIIFTQKTLAVADNAHQESVNFHQAGVDLGTVPGLKFHVFAAVHHTGQDLIKIIHLFLVEGAPSVQIVGGIETGTFGSATLKNLGW